MSHETDKSYNKRITFKGHYYHLHEVGEVTLVPPPLGPAAAAIPPTYFAELLLLLFFIAARALLLLGVSFGVAYPDGTPLKLALLPLPLPTLPTLLPLMVRLGVALPDTLDAVAVVLPAAAAAAAVVEKEEVEEYAVEIAAGALDL